MEQRVMWTALPAGLIDGGLRVSVAVTPLLDPQADPQALATFPDFVDWPGAGVEWHVAVGDADPVTATLIGDPPESALWTALFSPDTLVRAPDHPDYTGHLWWSYPVGHIVDFIQSLYQEVATAWPTEHPDVDWLLEPALGLRPLAHLDPNGADLRRELVRQLEFAVEQAGALPPGPPNPETDFLQVWRFHRPAPLGERPDPPRFDFHQAVALCREHPALARRLGLVVDLAVPGEFPDGPTTVRAEPGWEPIAGAASSDVLPTTACRIGDGSFLAEPKSPGEVVRGRLPLGGDAYRVVQVDQDSAALGLLQFARNLVMSRLRQSEDTLDDEALPSLASAGFAVARTGHAVVMKQIVGTGRDLDTARQAGESLLLHAEDVTRGFRFDVWTSATSQWHSLQDRISDYDFLSLPAQLEIAEEGFVVEVPTDRDDAQHDALYLQESLVRWEGWSLAAPRPGRTLLENDDVADAPANPADGFPLVMRFRAQPGSLPRLRFGETYRIRARTVDVAGNSVPFDGSDLGATDPLPYLRFEPVAAPVPLLAAPRTEGETVERVVLRSDYDAAPDPGTAQRHIAPPAVTQRTAEEHGAYDVAAGVDPGAYQAIVEREAKTFNDVGVVDADQWPESFRLPYFPDVPLDVPYLPDPMARGVALHGLPGGPAGGEFSSFAHAAGWPRSRPLRLVVEEGVGPPEAAPDDDEWVLTVRLPKAEVVKVRMSCHLDPDDLARSAIWQWMVSKPGIPDQQIEEWRTLAGRGLLWMLTPYRTLTLVHAVRRPLAAPAFTGPGPSRQGGETFADISGGLTLHGKSTSRVDLRASWAEPVDAAAGGGAPAPVPWVRDHQQVLAVPPRSGDQDADLIDFSVRHEFGDTKHRRVTYEAVATSAFTEYFVERDQVTLHGEDIVVLAAAVDGIVEDSEAVSIEGQRFVRGEHYLIDYAQAQLSRVPAADGIPDGATVDVEYLPEPVTRVSEEPVTLDIPSSARPPSPTVLYAVPTFKWSQGATSFQVTSDGEGGGLRLYLDRPLLQSGEGELLGVLLDPDPDDPHDALASYVTRWGFDPAMHTPPLPRAAPGPEQFTLAAEVGSARVLEENGAAVDVAGHAVGFDEDRMLWYCDVEVDSGSAHWPFIRLALASYQPTSLAGLHLSGVVLADFMQLAPDRYVTLVLGQNLVDVSVVGAGGGFGPEALASNEMTVQVEQQADGLSGEELGWETVPGTRPTPLQPQRDPSGQTRWTARVSLPRPRGRHQPSRLRLVVEEYELGSVGRGDGSGAGAGRETGGPGGGGRGQPGRGPVPIPYPNVAARSGEGAPRRLLYRDIIPLDEQRSR